LRQHRPQHSSSKTSGDLHPGDLLRDQIVSIAKRIVAIRLIGFRFFVHVVAPYLVLVAACSRVLKRPYFDKKPSLFLFALQSTIQLSLATRVWFDSLFSLERPALLDRREILCARV
jgi:hypothetical protein